MLGRCRGIRYFADDTPVFLLHNIRTDSINIRPVIGEFRINGVRRRPRHHQVGVAVHGEYAFPDHHIKGIFLIEKKHSVRIKIPQVLAQLAHLGKASVGINGVGKFIIRVRVVKMIVSNTAFTHQLLQAVPGKGAHHAAIRIILNPREKPG